MKANLPIGLALLLVVSSLGCRHMPVKEAAFSKEDFQAKQAEIWDEIYQFDAPDWAGKYQLHAMHGPITLLLAPRAGFVAYGSHMYSLYQNHGTVALSRRRLLLTFATKETWSHGWGITSEMVPVSWGQRHYLISESKLVDFCNAVNSGREPEPGAFGSDFSFFVTVTRKSPARDCRTFPPNTDPTCSQSR